MDPINAFQVAAAVIGLVDFGARVLSDTVEIYKSASGHTERDVELTTLSDELSNLSEQLQNRLEGTSTTSSASESTLRGLSARSIDASNKLKSAIADLQANKPGTSKISTAANSFASALKAIWKKSEIEALKENLVEIRSQITIATLISVWEETRQDGQRHGDLKDRLDQIAKKLDRRDDTAQLFAKELMQMTVDGNTNHLSRKNADLVNILWGIDWKSWDTSHGGGLFKNPQLEEQPEPGDLPISMKILSSLSFREIYARKQSIPLAYASTCHWIFRDEQSDENGEKLEWPSFPKWLQKKDDSLYWITGKPGSGKSTLMKYIFDNQQLRPSLKSYAGDLPLMLAGFFFWNPGSEVEKSQEGLIRTILHHCLSDRRDLIPVVAPRRWALYSILGSGTAAPEWTWRELKESFEVLCSLHGKEFQLVLFIDGLDEFGENGNSPSVLVDWILDIITRHHVKVCVSSRPWNVFSDAFRKERSLTMQSLTYRDIEHFVQTKFGDSVAFQELSEVFHNEASTLLKEIVERAEGVFLWVDLVVRSLLSTLVDTPSLPHLQEKLAEIPGDIKGLYNNIWCSIPPDRLATTSKIFQLCTTIRTSMRHSTANIFWLAIGGSPHAVMDPKAHQGIPKLMRRILDGHTRGMCELPLGGLIVQFLHRSASEWTLEKNRWDEICSKSPADFEPNLSLLEALIIVEAPLQTPDLTYTFTDSERTIIRSEDTFPTLEDTFEIVDDFLIYALRAQDSKRAPEDRLIKALDNAHKVTEMIMDMATDLVAPGTPRDGNPNSFSTDNWPAHAFHQKGGRFECSFVGAAARAGFTLYVKKKVLDDMSLLVPQRNRVSLLESAIFQHSRSTTLHLTAFNDPFYTDPTLSQRLEIIQFLLEVSDVHYKTASGEPMYDIVQKFTSKEFVDAFAGESESAEWYTQVFRLLEEHGYGPDGTAGKSGKEKMRTRLRKLALKLKWKKKDMN
ncbi:hypothetical protein EDB80DRAFT_610948 [Ilyonectria destructans]|nr:hypothetical protein EDB80DRAFT_610948 [Ilyonectria destructans]